MVCAEDTIEVDGVLVGIGLEPAVELAAAAGCVIAGAIEADAEGRTSIPGIWAAGDCALHHRPVAGRRICLESWHNAEEQGAAAGRSIAGLGPVGSMKKPWFWTDQFGVNIQMLGLIGPTDVVAFSGPSEAAAGAVYRTVDRETGRLTGVVAFSQAQAIRAGRSELDSMLTDDEIHRALSAHRSDPEAACRTLVEQANRKGGEDNITVIVWAATAKDADPAPPRALPHPN